MLTSRLSLALMVAMTVAFVGCASPDQGPHGPTASPSGSLRTPAASCQDMTHVYHPDRLLVLSPCVTVTGTIEVIRHEPDGDDHVLVKLDPGQKDPKGGNYLNAKNLSAQQGDLVTEPVCEHQVTQTDAISSCQGYQNPNPTPPVGTHVSVTGPWVLDQQHGWQEIHPAYFRAL